MNDLHGKTALITGGTSGIGRALALKLAARGAEVVIVGRSAAKGEAVAAAAEGGRITFIAADLSEMTQVQQVAEQVGAAHPRLDILVHSVGVHHYERTLTGDGIEYNFAVNYLNRFFLTKLLRPRLEAAVPSRIIIVGSPYVFDPRRFLTFDDLNTVRPLVALLQSGMANSVWTVALAEKLAGSGVTVCNMSPGIVRTDILRNDPLLVRLMDAVMQPLRGMSAEQAAENYAHLATAQGLSGELFYQNTRRGVVPGKVPRGTYDPALGERLWAYSESCLAPLMQPA